MRNLRLVVRRRDAGGFSMLLQGGVGLEAPAGTSVLGLLTVVMGLAADYVEARVATVFLDGEPVDDLGSALLSEGSVVALSAAMPGLAGGTMRRGSPLAALRSTVSHRPDPRTGEGPPVVVLVKVFNLLVEEFGLALLEKGVLVSSRRMVSFLQKSPDSFWEAVVSVVIDERPAPHDPSAAEMLNGGEETVRLSVRIEGGS